MSIVRDVRAGVRLARRSPLVSLGGILCIVLGIGATTALYSVLQHVVLRPLPYPDPHELVLLRETNRARNIIEAPVSFLEFILAAGTAVLVGALRAVRLDPMRALRDL